MNCDTAIKTRKLEVFLAVFVPSSPQLFNIDNPKLALKLSVMNAKARENQTRTYLCGLKPVGFSSLVDLGRMYSNGVTVCKEKLFGFDAISHLLSRHQDISSEEVKEMLEKKWKQGWVNIIFIKNSNLSGCENLPPNEWEIRKSVPEEDYRMCKLNEELSKRKSKFRVRTSKTFAMRTYGV